MTDLPAFTRPQSAAKSRRRQRAFCEALEDRQLMSLTVEVRNTDGTTATATATSVGQVLHLEVLAVISSSNHDPSGDGLQDLTGSFVSTALYGHAVAGNLASANVSPFNANGAQPGARQDLNGDGNLDVGSTSTTSTANYLEIRSSSIQTESSGTGTVDGNTLVFEIATLSYTVTSLNKGGETSINFVPYVSSTPDAARWAENGNDVDNIDATVQAGTPYVISDPSLVVAPTAINDTATVTKNAPATIDVLSNDDVIAPLNPASVVIHSAPAHGTTTLQSNGSVIYTPATNYVGTDSFTYTVADTDGRVSNTATVNLTVVNAAPPSSVADTASTLLDQPVTISVLANDIDPAGATITAGSVAIATVASHGTAVAQTNGTILYTPNAGFTGTDTFSYTEIDSNLEMSNPATVTVTVSTPIPPSLVSGTIDSTTTAGAPVTVNVLSNITAGSTAIVPTSVTIVTPPTDGTAAVQSNGSILYTPTAGFVGDDLFTYTLADTLGDVSPVGTVALTVNTALPPVAGTVTAPVLSGQTSSINVLSSVISAAPLVDSSLTIATAPTSGTASVNADGTLSYIPAAGFVGTDSFTYTVANVNGDISAPGTIDVNVGTTISNAKGATRSVSFTDAGAGAETVLLNKGSAEIFFTGTGSLTVARNGKGTVTGSGLALGSIALTGTTAGSSLTIKGSAKTPVTLGSITDSSPLGSIVAPSANVSSTVSLNSVGSIVLGNITDSIISIGAGLPGHTSFSAGVVTGTTLTSLVPITNLKVASWAGGQQITAPTINSLNVTGGFDAALALTNTNAKLTDLNSAKIGAVLDGSLTASIGGIGSISAASVNTPWTANIGAIKSLAIKTGGLGSTFSAGAVGTLSIGGNLTGTITAASVKAIHITGAVIGSTITTTGAISAISAASISGSSIDSGITSGTTLATATAGNLGAATIGSIKTGSFTNSSILAAKINAASLGSVTTGNSGTPFGIATDSLASFSGVFATGALHLGKAQLAGEVMLQSYLNAKNVTFGDFNIEIEG